ncbi:MAG: hypothetical protein IJU00_00295, partial [Selenomonas sp.]|nr:hypothetical protein [Selenomonas sp.]
MATSTLEAAKNSIDTIKNTIGNKLYSGISSVNKVVDEKTKLIDFKKQIKAIGNDGKMNKSQVPDDVYKAFALAINDAVGSSVIKKFKTKPLELTNQIHSKLSGGLKSIDDKKIIVGDITYTINMNVFAFSKVGTAFADVSWKAKNGKKNTVNLSWTNVGTSSAYAGLADYCTALAELNNDVWREFASYAITGTNKGKKVFDYAEKIVKAICDKEYANRFLGEMGNAIAKDLTGGITNKFRDYIKTAIPGGDVIVEAADLLKILESRYGELTVAMNNNKNIDKKVKAFNTAANKLEKKLKLTTTTLPVADLTTLPSGATGASGQIVLASNYAGTFDLTKYKRSEANVNASDVYNSLTIYGDDRKNTIWAGKGNYNYIYGGKGDDKLYGNSGTDYFKYYKGDGNDTIYNYDDGDVIDIENGGTD